MPDPHATGPTPDRAPPETAARWAARLARRGAALARARAADSARRTLADARRGASWLWARRPGAIRAVALAWSAAALAIGAGAVLAQSGLRARLPSSLDWAAARELVERDARPGDAVAISPPWAERARELLPSSVPVLARATYAGDDLVGVRRVWLLSLQGAPGFSYRADLDLAERAAAADPPERVGALAATRYDLAFPTLPLAFLPDRLAAADLSVRGAPCTREAGGTFECAGPTAARVERTVRDLGGAPRPCISATVGDGTPGPIVLAFPSVRVGRAVHGYVAGPAGPDAVVRVAVQVDGEEAGSAELAGTSRAFRVDTSRFATRTATLSLVVTPPGPGAVCLDAVVLP